MDFRGIYRKFHKWFERQIVKNRINSSEKLNPKNFEQKSMKNRIHVLSPLKIDFISKINNIHKKYCSI